MWKKQLRPVRKFARALRGRTSIARDFGAAFGLALSLTLFPIDAAGQAPAVEPHDGREVAETQDAPPVVAAESVTTLRLTAPQSMPGGETFVTILLENTPSQQLQSFKTEIEFDARHLTYVTARKGISAEVVRAELKVERAVITEPADAAAPTQAPSRLTRLMVAVTGTAAIPNGPVVELRFRVAEGLDGVNLKLQQRAEAFAPGGAKLEKLLAEPGEIRVTSDTAPKVPMVLACFFYMH